MLAFSLAAVQLANVNFFKRHTGDAEVFSMGGRERPEAVTQASLPREEHQSVDREFPNLYKVDFWHSWQV